LFCFVVCVSGSKLLALFELAVFYSNFVSAGALHSLMRFFLILESSTKSSNEG